MADFAPDKFTLFSNFNKDSKTEGAYWALAEWPVDQIKAFASWAVNDAEKVENQKGETCVVVRQALRPKTSKAGNEYLMGITSDPKPKAQTQTEVPW